MYFWWNEEDHRLSTPSRRVWLGVWLEFRLGRGRWAVRVISAVALGSGMVPAQGWHAFLEWETYRVLKINWNRLEVKKGINIETLAVDLRTFARICLTPIDLVHFRRDRPSLRSNTLGNLEDIRCAQKYLGRENPSLRSKTLGIDGTRGYS
ncbi:hypothetical protein B0H16DRAFT_1451525 [Mycena metata]|uniref:Uncharacterized protein n=1 Tax=Mycena metata TaxID=1033252 RepID=A0AAD7JXC8_9AGAR|nr:hypothetical protein B0H16DRAFT_1451525 [Mycena metata]